MTKTKLLPLPKSVKFWREWLAEPACDFHGLIGGHDEIDATQEHDRQLADLRDRGVMPWEAAAIVLAQYPLSAEPGSYAGDDAMPLAFKAGAVVMAQYLALRDDGQLTADAVAIIDRQWHTLAEAAGITPKDGP